MADKVKIDPDGIYSIGTAARLLGMSASTLRALERQARGHTDTGRPETVCRVRSPATPRGVDRRSPKKARADRVERRGRRL